MNAGSGAAVQQPNGVSRLSLRLCTVVMQGLPGLSCMACSFKPIRVLIVSNPAPRCSNVGQCGLLLHSMLPHAVPERHGPHNSIALEAARLCILTRLFHAPGPKHPPPAVAESEAGSALGVRRASTAHIAPSSAFSTPGEPLGERDLRICGEGSARGWHQIDSTHPCACSSSLLWPFLRCAVR